MQQENEGGRGNTGAASFRNLPLLPYPRIATLSVLADPVCIILIIMHTYRNCESCMMEKVFEHRMIFLTRVICYMCYVCLEVYNEHIPAVLPAAHDGHV